MSNKLGSSLRLYFKSSSVADRTLVRELRCDLYAATIEARNKHERLVRCNQQSYYHELYSNIYTRITNAHSDIRDKYAVQ